MRLTDPESQTLEYKREWSDTARKTMIAFANDFGGILQIGAADDGEVVGCNFDEVDRRVMTFARSGVEPSMTDIVRVIPQELDGKTIASVIVSPGNRKPYSFKGNLLANGGVYIRLGGQTVPATLDEVIRIIPRGDPRIWETRLIDDTELTFEAAEEIFSSRLVSFDRATWLGYGLVNSHRQFTNLALLISDQCPFHIVVNSYGKDGRIESSRRIEGSILKQLSDVLAILKQVNSPTIKKQRGRQERLEIYPWPELALREALTNSLVHRDYTSPIQSSVNIHAEKITFLTPGGIPPEISLQDAMVEGVSFCRNPKLSDLLIRLGYLESASSGFGTIFHEYGRFEHKPVFRRVVRLF